MRRSLAKFLRDESAATIVEYAIVLTLIGVVTIAALTIMGNTANTTLSNAGANLTPH